MSFSSVTSGGRQCGLLDTQSRAGSVSVNRGVHACRVPVGVRLIVRAAIATAAVALGFGCSSGTDIDRADVGQEFGVAGFALAPAPDCQNELKSCLGSASGVTARAQCVVGVQLCLVDDTADRILRNDLIDSCRGDARECLEDAVTDLDVSSCKAAFNTCADGTRNQARTLVSDAQDLISGTFDAALVTVSSVTGAPVGAAGQLRGCRAEANMCIDSALTSADVSACTDAFDTCVTGTLDTAVSVVDEVLETPIEVFDATADCRDSARACLRGAATALEVRSCRGLLRSCVNDTVSVAGVVVDGATSVVGTTIGGVLDVADVAVDVVDDVLPIARSPRKVLDCSGQLLSCLASAAGPFACATVTRDCLRN